MTPSTTVERLLRPGDPVGRPVHLDHDTGAGSRVSRSRSPASRPGHRTQHVRLAVDRLEDRRRPPGAASGAPRTAARRRARRTRTRSPRSTSGRAPTGTPAGAGAPIRHAWMSAGSCSTAASSSVCGRSSDARSPYRTSRATATPSAFGASPPAPAVDAGQEAGHRAVVADVHDPLPPCGTSDAGRARSRPPTTISSVTVSGQRISSSVAAASTAPAGSTVAGSARNAAHAGEVGGGAPQLGGRRDRAGVDRRLRPGVVGVGVDQVAGRGPVGRRHGDRARPERVQDPLRQHARPRCRRAARRPGGRAAPRRGWSSGSGGRSAARARSGPGRRAARRRPAPAACPRRRRTARAGCRRCATAAGGWSGRRTSADVDVAPIGSSRSSSPSSRHCMTSTAVNVFVTDPSRNWVPASSGRSVPDVADLERPQRTVGPVHRDGQRRDPVLGLAGAGQALVPAARRRRSSGEHRTSAGRPPRTCTCTC